MDTVVRVLRLRNVFITMATLTGGSYDAYKSSWRQGRWFSARNCSFHDFVGQDITRTTDSVKNSNATTTEILCNVESELHDIPFGHAVPDDY